MEDTAGVGNADGLGGETKFCLERANHERQLKRSRFIQRGSGCVASPVSYTHLDVYKRQRKVSSA